MLVAGKRVNKIVIRDRVAVIFDDGNKLKVIINKKIKIYEMPRVIRYAVVLEDSIGILYDDAVFNVYKINEDDTMSEQPMETSTEVREIVAAADVVAIKFMSDMYYQINYINGKVQFTNIYRSLYDKISSRSRFVKAFLKMNSKLEYKI